ncbi:DUF2330 domain-containing protein [Thermoproteota archaeon]
MAKTRLLKLLTPVLLMTLLMIILSSTALADGGFFPPVYYNEDIYEPTQKGVIFFDGAEERLIILATYEGEMNDFAWIIPVPSYPDVNKTSPELFEELHYLTKPNYRTAPGFGFGMRSMSKSFAGDVMEQVTVHEQKQVGVYEVSILSSENPKALLEWLNENQYRISTKAESVLDFYVQKKWYFIAMRINLAPFEEKLVESLKNINPHITDSQTAVDLLTEDLVNTVMSEILYDGLSEIRTTRLDYGEDDPELMGDYRYARVGPKPISLITERDYNNIYEQYNGYFEEHITRDVSSDIGNDINRETRMPSANECYGSRGYHYLDYSHCNVWYLSGDSAEYQTVKNVECGKYCSLVAEEKGKYSINDIAQAAAYAAVKEDQAVISFFSISTEKRNWYETERDLMKYYQNQVESRLRSVIGPAVKQAEEEIKQKVIDKYSSKTDQDFSSVNEITNFLTQKTLDDFEFGKGFAQSYISGFDVMSQNDYNRHKKNYEGNHDDISLRNNLKQKIESVVYWKQETIQRRLGEGTVQPLDIKFSTQTIIYPLKISSVNKGASEILLYVFAKHKTQVAGIKGFKTEYAKWIETDDIKTESYYNYMERRDSMSKEMMPRYWNPRTYYHLNQMLDDRYFLTKFRKEMWPKEMTDDLVIMQADNNDEYLLTVYEDGYIFKWIAFFIVLGILWGLLFAFCFLPRWLNNKIIHHNELSSLFMTVKRCAAYAAVIPIGVFFGVIFPRTMGDLIENLIVDPLGEVFEFIFHLFHFMRLPDIIGGTLVFLIAVASMFLIIHLIGSGIVRLYNSIRGKKQAPQY